MAKSTTDTDRPPGNYQSLLGYARGVHKESGGRCAYCEYGACGVDFDMWRQLSLEHVIPSKWLEKGNIRPLLNELWGLGDNWRKPYQRVTGDEDNLEGFRLKQAIEQESCVTACHFCNSATSRFEARHKGFREEWEEIFRDPGLKKLKHKPFDERKAALLERVRELRKAIFEQKKADVKKKLDELEPYFDQYVKPELDRPGVPGTP